MREVKIDCNEVVYSKLGFATELNKLAMTYESDILIVIESENKVEGQVDLKSYLGVVAAMSNQSKTIHVKIIGADDDFASFDIKKKIENLIKKYSN